MNKLDEKKIQQLQELICDEYCKYPRECSQAEIDKQCESCQIIRNLADLKD